jgi:hypothetical protein
MWEIVLHKHFESWFFEQLEDLQDSIAMVFEILESEGTSLGRPYVDTLKGSSLPNLKELRVQHKGAPYRLLFIFDPLRQAVVLVGGNKGGDKQWYKKNIPIAEKLYSEYLKEIQKES